MNIRQYLDKGLIKQSARAGLLIVIIAAITLEATALVQYLFSRKGIKEEATFRAKSEMQATENEILDIIDQTEAAVRNNVWIAQFCLDLPDTLARVAELIVSNNPVVAGSTVALVPGYNKRFKLFSPYVCYDQDGSLRHLTLATEEYDYPSAEWFTRPIALDAGYWSEPYIDEGGGEILMSTYSMPVKDVRGQTAAVLTADLSLEWLKELIGNLKVYPNAFSVLTSRDGQLMVSGMPEGFDMDKTPCQVFACQIDRTGWNMSIVIPDDEIYGGIKRMGLLVTLLQVLGLAMIVVMLSSLAKSQLNYQLLNQQKQRMEGELKIASDIQMSMVPKIFPPFPNRDDLDMSACIVPAKEVGGDLYDFYIRDEKLFFCIGDVSGKGVPASLVMAVTRSMFRIVSAHEDNAMRIVSAMNQSMSDMNESNMFVTFFCGILDLTTGQLTYCNAGHNPPMVFTDHIALVPIHASLPLGIMKEADYFQQELDMHYDDALFLYTDGLTEAENREHELFGEERAQNVMRVRRTAADHLAAVQDAVKDFVGEAPQSDDLTMLFIHYTKKGI